MYGNSNLDSGFNERVKLDSEQATAFRKSVQGVRTRVDEKLTSAFSTDAQLRTGNETTSGVIFVESPAGSIQFTIDAKQTMFNDDQPPISEEQAERVSTKIAATICAEFLSNTNMENAPAQ